MYKTTGIRQRHRACTRRWKIMWTASFRSHGGEAGKRLSQYRHGREAIFSERIFFPLLSRRGVSSPASNPRLYDAIRRRSSARIITSPNLTTAIVYVNDAAFATRKVLAARGNGANIPRIRDKFVPGSPARKNYDVSRSLAYII